MSRRKPPKTPDSKRMCADRTTWGDGSTDEGCPGVRLKDRPKIVDLVAGVTRVD